MLYEDEHLLVVNKPAGWNTHAPSPHSGEGLYDWLRHREPAWAGLAILHRLDKATSGLLVFGKTRVANRSLARQFDEQCVEKRYMLLTDRPVRRAAWSLKTRLERRGPRYASRADSRSGPVAETHFTRLSRHPCGTWVRAEPRTGRTHQIRVHAAESGIPVLGDALYGGTAFPRVCLHSELIAFHHPASGEERRFTVPADFDACPSLGLRAALVTPGSTNAFRVVHGSADGWPGWSVDRLGDYLLAESATDPVPSDLDRLRDWHSRLSARGVYHKRLSRHVRTQAAEREGPRKVLGETAPERFPVVENGVPFELSFHEGYSVGLFLDQRDNRRRLLTGHIAAEFPCGAPNPDGRPMEVLNLFAYTCGFSVCAARSGMHVTSIDLSRKYLDWGRRNFRLSDLDPDSHTFLHGDAMDWMRRLRKRGRRYGLILLDPPTFSKSRQSGLFRAERDYGRLVADAVALLEPNGILFASTNAARWPATGFLETVRSAIGALGRRISREHYAPQAPDFPVHPEDPAYLKTVWLRVA